MNNGHIRFTQRQASGDRVVVHLEGTDADLDLMLASFTQFLQGCGYYLEGKTVQLVDEDTPDRTIEERDGELTQLLSDVKEAVEAAGLTTQAPIYNRVADYMDKEGLRFD
jgi:hypothetical protein